MEDPKIETVPFRLVWELLLARRPGRTKDAGAFQALFAEALQDVRELRSEFVDRNTYERIAWDGGDTVTIRPREG